MPGNLALLGAYSDATTRDDDAAVYRCWSPDLVSHVTARVNPAAIGTDLRSHEVEWWRQVRSAFPNMRFDVELLIESGDRVVSNWTVRGTHDAAPFHGVEPSGRPVEISGTAILGVRDGQVVEHWIEPHCQDGVGLTHGPQP